MRASTIALAGLLALALTGTAAADELCPPAPNYDAIDATLSHADDVVAGGGGVIGADYTPHVSAQDIDRQRQYADDAVAGGGGTIGPTGVHAVACPGWSP